MKMRNETEISNIFTIDTIVSIHYIHLNDSKPENIDLGVHYDFWQILYVAEGFYECKIADAALCAKKGQVIFCPPGEVRCTIESKNTVMGFINFRCNPEPLKELKGKVISLSSEEKKLLANILSSGLENFEQLPETAENIGQKVKDDAKDYEIQAFKNYLELFLLKLYKNNCEISNSSTCYNKQFLVVKSFLNEHIGEALSVDDIAKNTGFSVSTLKRIFSSCAGCGVIHFFINMKIAQAKKLIKETDMKLTDISRELGFSSIHYFSKAFKTSEGISPKKYAQIIFKEK